MADGDSIRSVEGALEPRAVAHFQFNPIFILRVAGEPADGVEAIADGSSARAYAEIADRAVSLAPRRQALCDRLEAIVPVLGESRLIGHALAIRRAIFRSRAPPAKALDSLVEFLPAELLAEARAVADEIARLEADRTNLVDVYEEERAKGARALSALFKQENVHNGILQASGTLYSKLKSALLEEAPLKPKERLALENALVSYYLRASSKTSPQSSFTPLALGNWDDSASPALAFDLEGWRLSSFLSVRRSLLLRIIAPFLTDVGALGDLCRVQLNPTLSVADGAFRLIRVLGEETTLKDIVWGQQTSEVQGRWTGLLALIHSEISRGSVTIGALRERLAQNLPGQPKSDLQAFIGRLLKLQLIRPETGIDEQGDLTRQARAFFEALGTERAIAAARLLEETARLCDAWREAGPEQRHEIVRSVENALRDLSKLSGAEVGDRAIGRATHENCYLGGGRRLRLSEDAFAPIRRDLEQLLGLMPLFDPGVRIQATVARRFREAYGQDGICDQPLDFLSSLSRDIQDLTFGSSDAAEPPDPIVSQLDSLNAELRTRFLAPKAGEELLPREFIDDLIGRIPAELQARTSSQSFFGQCYRDGEGRLRFVINQVYQGYARLMARFFEAEGATPPEVRAHLGRLSPAGRIAEIPGSFGFNVNVHPMVADLELSIPPFTRNSASTQPIPVSDLRLTYDKRAARVILTTGDGRRLDAYFFGTMMAQLLPHAYRGLEALNGQMGLIWNAAREIAIWKGLSGSDVVKVDRLNLNTLTLARATWFVPRSHLPATGASEAEFYFTAQQWRREHGLPSKVFVRFPPPFQQLENVYGDESVKDVTKLKPIMLDFENPYIVSVFRKTLKSVDVSAVFTEVLPGVSDSIIRINGKRHVSEFHFELARIVANE